jgi:hypothetical protein
MVEFDDGNQALNLTSGFDEITEFLKKIADIKEKIDNIINGKDEQSKESSPSENNKKIAERKKKIKAKADSKKSKWSFEFIPPSIGLSVGWFAERPKDLVDKPIIGTTIEGIIDFNPLFGFEIKYDLFQLLYRTHPAVAAIAFALDVLDTIAGDKFDIDLDLIVTTTASGTLKGTINTAEESSYKERLLKDGETPAEVKFSVDISVVGKIRVKGKPSLLVFSKYTAYANVSASIESGVALKFETKMDDKSLFVEPTISFEGLILKYTFSTGIAYDDRDYSEFENTDFNYEQNGITIPTQSKTYNDWIPSLGLNYSNNGLTMGISYNTNISRPSYSMLNNNYFYVSHTSWETGNPLLLSSKDHNIDLHFSYNHTYITASYTRRKRNISTTYTYLQSQNVNVRQEINLPDYDRFQIVASQSFDIGKWHPTLQGLLQFQNLKYGSPEKHYDSPLGRLMMNNRFDLPWHVYAYLSGMYLTKGHDATVYSNGGAMIYMMLNKNVGKWSFNLLANDFVSSWRQKNLVETNGVYYLDNRKGASCFVRLSITYSFNHKSTFKGKGASKEELNRL